MLYLLVNNMPPLHTLPSSIPTFLQDMGFKEKECRVYIALLKVGNAPVRLISREAHLERTTTYNILLRLRRSGLVASYTKRGKVHFSAVSPARLRDLLDKRIAEQERLKTVYQTVLPDLMKVFHQEAQVSSFKVFEGIDSLAAIYWSLYEGAAYPDESLEFTNWGGKNQFFPEALRQQGYDYLKKVGMKTRALLVEDEMTREWKTLNREKEMAKEIRFVPNLGWKHFVNMELCGQKIALVTYRDDVHFQGVLIDSPELSAMFRFFFETMWKMQKND